MIRLLRQATRANAKDDVSRGASYSNSPSSSSSSSSSGLKSGFALTLRGSLIGEDDTDVVLNLRAVCSAGDSV
jgi:hypothetical protein